MGRVGGAEAQRGLGAVEPDCQQPGEPGCGARVRGGYGACGAGAGRDGDAEGERGRGASDSHGLILSLRFAS